MGNGSNYVIIGNSGAAIGAVAGIRAIDASGAITLISAEPYHTYARPYLPYWLEGKLTEEKMRYRPADFYEKNRVTPMLGKRAVSIDCGGSCVLLEGGEAVPYGKLMVGTGSRPFVPPFQGLESVPRKHTFQSYDDAKRVAADVRAGERALVVGAGLIGLKAGEALFARGLSVTVVDLADKILSSILDARSAKLVERHIVKQGVDIRLGVSVQAFDQNVAKLSNGDELAFDVLILAVGVRPNTELVAGAGGAVDRGILTDTHQKTTLERVYAAGDCTQSIDAATGRSKILALLPNAYMQGEIAGRNMAGGADEYVNAIAMNAIAFFGLQTITAGSYEGDPAEQRVAETDATYRGFFLAGGLLKGFILVGDVSGAASYVGAIKTKAPAAGLFG